MALTTQRKKKPKQLAVILDNCTGCAGSPVCVELCPVDECMLPVPDPDNGPFVFIWVDPLKCIGCLRCTTSGVLGTQIEGCPWDAIRMVGTKEWEEEHGELPY